MINDPLALTARQLTGLFAKRALSPVELVDAVFERVDREQPQVNCFILLDRDGARKAAKASQERWVKAAPLGPADGLVATIGRTRLCARAPADHSAEPSRVVPRMARRHDKHSGRSTSERFIRLPHYMVRSPAYLSLSLAARAILTEVLALFTGTNNGSLGYTARRGATALNCSKDMAARALVELQEKGFLEVVKYGSFSLKARLATEYRTTLYACNVTGKPASKNFMRWPQKFSDGPTTGTDGPTTGTVTPFRPLKTGSTVRLQGP